MQQKLFVIGLGNVGREFIKRVITKDSEKFHRNPTVVLGVAEPGKFVFSSEGLSVRGLHLASESAEGVQEFLTQGKSYDDLGELLEVVQEAGLDGEVIFIDTTAGKDELRIFHKQVITKSKNSIVTANKNPIALYGVEDFKTLTKFHHRYDANVTVMGGAGIVPFINERREIQDEIKNIQGCFSGTLGYILSELELGEKTFSEIVRGAKEHGYTEPNPWDDLNGLDVARKILILARYAGYDVSINDVKVVPLIEEKFGKLRGEEFLQSLAEKDDYFSGLQKESEAENKVLRYVAEMKNINSGKISLEVALKKMSKDSEFGSLQGTANLVVVETDSLENPVPHVIKSRGAGLSVTADALRTGILRLMPLGVQNRKDKLTI